MGRVSSVGHGLVVLPMEIEYDGQAFDPPAPALSITLSHPVSRGPGWNVLAQIDTGADVTAVPLEALTRLRLEQTGELPVIGYDAQLAQLPIYAVWLALPTGPQVRLNVLTIPSDYVLLGRDALNHLRLLLDGPALTLEVLPPLAEA